MTEDCFFAHVGCLFHVVDAEIAAVCHSSTVRSVHDQDQVFLMRNVAEETTLFVDQRLAVFIRKNDLASPLV
ncbi:hypothetical protein ACFWRG_35180, partial [Micromonospora tulbaghiae]|uniref:hypothetical protein n=1 Tax=Micromonospora tulbaghiae TaxID=479978 RepID=UPI003663402E